MNTLTLLAVAATGMAVGGVTVASWRTTDRVVVSLLRAHDINTEAEAALDDLRRDEWWEAVR